MIGLIKMVILHFLENSNFQLCSGTEDVEVETVASSTLEARPKIHIDENIILRSEAISNVRKNSPGVLNCRKIGKNLEKVRKHWRKNINL